MIRKGLLCSTIIAGAVCGLANVAGAETAAGQNGKPAVDKDASTIEEIVVTAEKRSEHLQEVPIQIDVLTAKGIQDRQIRQTADIVTTMPNLTVEKTDTYTNSVIVLRGLAQASNADAPVAVIVDGVPQDDAKQFNMHLFDISQIEVLKGPQGSLYGRNAEAGAIIIKTAEPTNKTEGFGDLSYGNGATLETSAGISGAIVPDKVQYRLSGSFYKTGGLIPNSFNGTKADKVDHDWTVRGALLFHLNEKATLSLIGQHGEFKAKAVYFTPVFSGDANDIQNPQGNFPNRSSGKSSNLTAKLTNDFGFATFMAISGYSYLQQIQTTDVDFTSTPAVGDNQPYHNKIFSQEIRLVSPDTLPLRWLLAADYLHADQFISTNIFLDQGDPVNDPTNPAGIIQSNPANYKRSNFGFSGQLDYDIAQGLTLTAGARYDTDKRTQEDLKNGGSRDHRFSHFQPKIAASYKFDQDKLVYASFAQGFRSGGFNPTNFPVPIYGSEVLTNYEAGFKSQWFDRKVTFNGAFFHSRVKNYQFSYIDFALGAEVTGGIDRVEINGAELELNVIPVEGLSLYGKLGLADPKIKSFSIFPQYEGNIVPRGYKASYYAGFDYSHNISDNVRAFIRGDMQRYSSKYWFVDNLNVQRPKTYVNGSLGFGVGSLTMSVWGKNIFNTRAYETYFPAQSTGLPYDVGFPNRPASYGVELTFKY